MNKVFIIGLPRTGTTSLCEWFLRHGYPTAHCAFTTVAFDQAIVLADSPIFSDYQQLDKRYPDSRFILTHRAEAPWCASIRQLLNDMAGGLFDTKPLFNAQVKRAFTRVFAPLTAESATDSAHLWQCAKQHREEAITYFQGRKKDLLEIDVTQVGAENKLRHFLDMKHRDIAIPHRNQSGVINDWMKLDHHLKVKANRTR